MIATIVFGTLILIFIVLLVFEIVRCDSTYSLIVIIFLIVLLVISLCIGYYSPVSPSYSKEEMILIYEKYPSERTLKNIISYNYEVERGNDLWCRFKKEDRSELLIDVDGLLKGDKDDVH